MRQRRQYCLERGTSAEAGGCGQPCRQGHNGSTTQPGLTVWNLWSAVLKDASWRCRRASTPTALRRN